MKRKIRAGITLTELVIVILIIAILAAASTPVLLSMIESGRQMNRMNIARTIYLAAQNQLTEMRTTGVLDEFVESAGIDDDSNTRVFNLLGSPPNWPDSIENQNYVHFISLPAGFSPDLTGLEPEEITSAQAVISLLQPVLTYQEILNDAILIEFNVRTGVVLSVFYSDRFAPGQGFLYAGGDNTERLINNPNPSLVPRGMGMGAYEGTARDRRQGYYGVGETGRRFTLLEDLDDVLSIRIIDSFDDREDDFSYPETYTANININRHNMLYARILISNDLAEANMDNVFEVSIEGTTITDEVITIVSSFILDDLENYDSFNDANDEGFFIDYSSSEGYSVIWILDYVAGDTTSVLEWGINGLAQRVAVPDDTGFVPIDVAPVIFDPTSGIRATVIIEGFDRTSNRINPYFGRGSANYTLEINSARHLYNIHHTKNFPTASDLIFIQRQHIDMRTERTFSVGSSNRNNSNITNFLPLPTLTGTYNGNQRVITNLIITGQNTNVGLFTTVSGTANNPAIVTNLTLANPTVSGSGNVGAITGTLGQHGRIEGAFVRFNREPGDKRYDDDGNLIVVIDLTTDENSFIISGTATDANIGGLVGRNNGYITDSTFVSPAKETHIKFDDIIPFIDITGHKGGFVGYNDINGDMNRTLLFSLAPSVDIPGINDFGVEVTNRVFHPFVGININHDDNENDLEDNETLLYLSGVAFRPETTNFNRHHNNGVGFPFDTLDIRDEINTWPASWNWIPSDVSNIDALHLNHTPPFIPFPYPTFNGWDGGIGAREWPITVEGLIKLRNIYYYEKYGENDYGIYHPGNNGVTWLLLNDTQRNAMRLRDNTPVLEAGYVIILDPRLITEEYTLDLIKLYADANPQNKTANTWVQIVFDLLNTENTDTFSPHLLYLANNPGGTNIDIPVFRLSLNQLYTNMNTAEDRTRPLLLAYGFIDAEEYIQGSLHPYFAKAICDDLPETTTLGRQYQEEETNIIRTRPYTIRTPWQMQNISLLHEEDKPDDEEPRSSKDIFFLQDRNMNFVTDTGTGSGANPIRLTNAVVTGTFEGTYDGLVFDGMSIIHYINHLTINYASGDLSTGLFEHNNGTIQNLILRNANINGQNNTGGIAGQNNKTITRVGIEYSTVTGVNNVGGFVGYNYGRVEDVYFLSTAPVINVPVSGTGDAVGGIVGYNVLEDEDDGILAGVVTRSLYLAPAPFTGPPPHVENNSLDITVFYPIVGDGEPGYRITVESQDEPPGEDDEPGTIEPDFFETNVFLRGHRHNENIFWPSGTVGPEFAPYNRTYESNSNIEGGGIGLRTELFAMEFLQFLYRINLNTGVNVNDDPVFWRHMTFYPYPILNGASIPPRWPMTESPPRPDQVEWGTPAKHDETGENRVNAPDFQNGNFTEGFILPPDYAFPEFGNGVDNILIPPYAHIGFEWFSIDMSAVSSWYTRPRDTGLFNPTHPLYYLPAAGDPIGDWRSPWNPTTNPSTVPRWRLIEFQEPNGSNAFMRTNYLGQNRARNIILNEEEIENVRNSPYRYAELNAETPGTLYQVLKSDSGATFYYSFFHATNAFNPTSAENLGGLPSWMGAALHPPANSGDRLNFYLSPVDTDNPEIIVVTQSHANERDDIERMVLIRPALSPRSQPTLGGGAFTDEQTITLNDSVNMGLNPPFSNLILNPAAWNTVAYGASNQAAPTLNNSGGPFNLSYHNGKEYIQVNRERVVQNIYPNYPTRRTIYLYDVWIGSTSTTAANGGTRTGFGITFWSTRNLTTSAIGSATNIPLNGITQAQFDGAGTATWTWLDDARTNVIGYWGVEFGWKHYFGEYTVPEEQALTEFAFQSATGPSRVTVGNYLDGVSFSSPAFLSIDKYIRDEDGNDIMFTNPGDKLFVDVHVVNHGETNARDIVITHDLTPFFVYVNFIDFIGDDMLPIAGLIPVIITRTSKEGDVDVLEFDDDDDIIIFDRLRYPDPDDPESVIVSYRLRITLPGDFELKQYDELHIRYGLEVLPTVLENTHETPTLLYFFRNQVIVNYKEHDIVSLVVDRRSTFEHSPYGSRTISNATDPNQIFIDPLKLDSSIKTIGHVPTDDNPDLLINGPFEIELSVEDTVFFDRGSSTIETQGLIILRIPADFRLVGSINKYLVVDDVEEPVDIEYEITPNPDGTTRVHIRPVNIGTLPNRDDKRKLLYRYQLEYIGDPHVFGVFHTEVTAEYMYLYTDNENHEALSVVMRFPRLLVGIRPEPEEITFTEEEINNTGTTVLPVLGDFLDENNNWRVRADSNYVVVPSIELLVQEDGEWVGVQQYIYNGISDNNDDDNEVHLFTISINVANRLEFTPTPAAAGMTFEIYYRIYLEAFRPGANLRFDLTTDPVLITIHVPPEDEP
jgi:type II secretory pathway pseudopilin PulG